MEYEDEYREYKRWERYVDDRYGDYDCRWLRIHLNILFEMDWQAF